MTGTHAIFTYQEGRSFEAKKLRSDPAKKIPLPQGGKLNSTESVRADQKFEAKAWSPIDPGSSLVPKAGEYGNAIGDVKLSDKAKDYYEELRSKNPELDFIAVSKDLKGEVRKNAASYGNANKMVVLIDEEKLELMANDESFRKKYEGIIAISKNKMSAIKNSLTSSGAAVSNFGMEVDGHGNESFFATVERSGELQKERIEKKAAEKKEQKAREKKKEGLEEQKERLQKARDKKAYMIFESDSLEGLISKVNSYTYDNSLGRVMTESERDLGGTIDYRG